ncbi:MAG TPA: hypothetical protein VFR67_24595 [Pilimelia sp.]|nr:hypothetical protein [Pilimelia sp.]
MTPAPALRTSRRRAGHVVAEGHVQFEGFTPAVIPVDIQFSPTGTGRWCTVATVDSAEWDGTGYHFAAAVGHRTPGYWRASYPGVPDWFQPAVSAAVFVR